MKTKITILSAMIIMILASCGNKSSKFSPDLFPVKSNDKWGYVDKEGKYVINPQFSYADFFSCGLALVANDDGKYGYIDEKGNYIINAQYIAAMPFSENKACVGAAGSAPKYIDTKGELLFELATAVEAGNFHNGLAKFKDDKGKWGFIDKEGSIAINAQFDAAMDFSGELAAVKIDGKDGNEDKWGYINPKGEYAVNPQFREAYPFTDDLACVSNGEKYGFINGKGEYVINPQFERAGIFLNKMAPVKNDKTWGYIDEEGKFVINPQFDEALCFAGDLAPVSQNGVWGYINTEGKIIVNTQFEDASMFIGNTAIVESNGKYGFIDKEGKFRVNPQFDRIDISRINMYAIFGTGFRIYNNTVSSNKNESSEEVALAFLKAFNKNDTVEAKKLATEESYSYITLMAGLSNLGGSGKEKKIENMKCVDNDDKSKCSYTENGEEKQLDLVKKNGMWLVDMKKESPKLDESGHAGILPVTSVTASSYMAQSGIYKYIPQMAVDNDLQTWWSPAAPHSDGMNSWLKIDFGGTKKVSGIEIHNGSHFPNYPKYGNLYLKNNRLKKARLEFSNGSSEIITLNDVDEIQKINFSPVNTSFVRLVPLEMAKGSTWNDLCISSFKAVGK